MKRVKLLALVMITCLPISAFAETVILKSGKSIEGKIIEKTDEYIKIDFQGVPLTYFYDEIKRIEGKELFVPAETEAVKVQSEMTAKEIFRLYSPAVVYIETDKGFGSGFIIDKSGTIVTNYHVVGSAESIKIKLKDGKEYQPVSCLNYNILADLCILKINPESDLDFISIGDEEREEIGEKVIAIGNPAGYDYSISDGIISRKSESLYRKMVQFTCPISSGSSGGPLLNMAGKAIGVVTQALLSSDGIQLAQNVNSAVSIINVKGLLNSKEEIPIVEFLGRIRENAAFFQASFSPNNPEKYEYIMNLHKGNISLKDRFMMRLELLRILVGDCLFSYLTVFQESFLQKKKEFLVQDRKKFLEWSLEGIGIIEKTGGVEEMLKYYKMYFSPSENAIKMTREHALVVPYYSAALASFSLGDEKGFLKYYNKVKEFVPNSNLVFILEQLKPNIKKE